MKVVIVDAKTSRSISFNIYDVDTWYSKIKYVESHMEYGRILKILFYLMKFF